MRVSAANVLALLGTATLVAAAPTSVATAEWVGPMTGNIVETSSEVAVRSEGSEGLAKRAIGAAILTAFGTAAATAAAEAAVKAAVNVIGQIANWDNARESFTKETVKAMSARNPNPSKFAATICYNMAYDLEVPSGIDGKVSVKFTSGPLHTNYDCFYMTAHNSFWSRGDGGYINLAIMSDSRCRFDSNTADLWCP